MSVKLLRWRALLVPIRGIGTLDPQRLKLAAETLCDVFGIPSLHPHQEETGKNILRGISTFLDVPTGGGKTIAFWYALFYHWQPRKTAKECQKIVLVLGPLMGLLEAQAKTLNEKKIPAVAITSKSENTDQLLTDLGNNKFRVGLVGPEMALSTKFHEKVLNNILFTENIITLVIDEAHCICEWGEDDFRPDYRKIVELAARLPTSTPLLAATATAPRDVIKDIMDYLDLPSDTARVQVSNEKPNVSLAVRILQQEQSFADLITLFPEEFTEPKDFLQTLIYVNGRQDAEKIQDFLRKNTPEGINSKIFEFYHKDIEPVRKTLIQDGLNDGTMRGVPATDALGLGMDFRAILRVLLWMTPRTFLSLIQKIGRCVRDHTMRGLAVLYITKAMYKRAVVELNILQREEEDSSEKGCRRIPWNKFFGNKDKHQLVFPVPEGPCCDNCDPDELRVERVVLVGGHSLKTGRREKSSPELEAAVREKLDGVRKQIMDDHYPNQHLLTGHAILPDDIVDTLAQRARLVTSVDALLQQTRWSQASRFGNIVVDAIEEVKPESRRQLNVRRGHWMLLHSRTYALVSSLSLMDAMKR
ncbi:P-loop containing nucleoside triphosphate hydrolase protein [Mycena latifolia]|nr:P-loop containing nucleoside triphosphate hydrolase protein [Mycena latifolia]